MKAIAPGKLILSGEHAVVYGKPALAMAVNRSASSIVLPEADGQVGFDLVDLRQSGSFTLHALRELRDRLAKNYRLFLNGQLTIREVLHKPIDLFQFAFITVLDGLHLKCKDGIKIQLRSNIPIGCGMGSSAATILSVLRAMGHYFRVEFRPDWYYRYGLETENLQHGFSSGVDTYISLHGGCVRYQNGEATQLPLPRVPMYLVNTGSPANTTGESVVQVRARFGGSAIWDEFEAVTLGLERALGDNRLDTVQSYIRENHRLLERIGVVPDKVRAFVAAVEQSGGAAKICGAGAVQGDQAGMVVVFSKRPPTEACREFDYALQTVRGDPLGVRIVG